MPKKQAIKRFASKRGRPRQSAPNNHESVDLGTPELILKRSCGLTAEPIDICLERQLINEQEHRAALHLRWLYTIRHGAPGISALNLARGDGQDLLPQDEPRWRAQRERDYHEAIALLKSRRYDALIIPCVIYNEPPDFINKKLFSAAFSHHSKITLLQRHAARFSEGLELLSTHFYREKSAPY